MKYTQDEINKVNNVEALKTNVITAYRSMADANDNALDKTREYNMVSSELIQAVGMEEFQKLITKLKRN